jgi:hypothetical protein
MSGKKWLILIALGIPACVGTVAIVDVCTLRKLDLLAVRIDASGSFLLPFQCP